MWRSTAGRCPKEMRALHRRGPQAYLLTLPLTLSQGRAGQRAGRGQGLGTPPPPLPSRRRRGPVLTAPCRQQGAPMAGRPVGCPPPPLWRRWGKTTTSPCRMGRRAQRRSAGSQGPPQGCHRGPAGRGGAGLGPGLRATAVGARVAFWEAEAMGGPVTDSH